MSTEEKLPDRYYVPRSFFKWKGSFEVDIGLGAFTLSGDYVGNSIGFMPVYSDIRLYNRDWPDEDPIIFDASITEIDECEGEKDYEAD